MGNYGFRYNPTGQHYEPIAALKLATDASPKSLYITRIRFGDRDQGPMLGTSEMYNRIRRILEDGVVTTELLTDGGRSVPVPRAPIGGMPKYIS